MDLTIIIIFIVALVLSVGFLLVVFSVVPAINQFKALLIDLEKTSTEARELTIRLKILSEKIDEDVEKVNELIDTSKETFSAVSKSVKMINASIFKKYSGLIALIPAIKFGWNIVRKIKGGK
jgi:uncharacterized protein YoxC